MGVFEKAIPRYTYDPVQKLTVQPVQDYYVDDIFDPIFNRNVRNALTQKYGNPLLGTVMGYYEGVENALFGQNDKWGILGPGMGILSGFGRSMDKAGDVILGTLTEGVKGITGQGVENPLENIFVEDQDYTGRRALAAMANSMRGLAGGTTVSEEDFGGAWGLPSLAIELTTDPSILGGNLTKIANKPNILPQLASAKNSMGKVGKFLQEYDDIMAKAAIDITAPGLRQAIGALRSKWHTVVGNNFATKYTDAQRKIYDVDLSDEASVKDAVDMQKELANDQTLATVADMDAQLEDLERRIEDSLKARGLYDQLMSDTAAAASVPLLPSAEYSKNFAKEQEARRAAAIKDFEDASKTVEAVPNLTDAEISEAEAAHRAMALPRRKLKALIRDYRNLTSIDIAKLEEYSKEHAARRSANVSALNSALKSRNEEFYTAVQSFIDYVKKRGGDTNILTNPYNNDKVFNAYTNFVKKYLNLPDDTVIDNLDKYANTLHDPNFEEYLRDVLSPVLDNGNPEYVWNVDLRPYAWQTATFSENEALNDAVIRALEEGFPKFTTPQSGVSLSPSQMGKMSDDILDAGNAFADEILADVFIKDTAKGVFPKVTSKEEFVAAFKNKNVADAFKLLVPDKAAREDLVEKMSRLFFPPEEIMGPYGKSIPYDQYRRMKDYEETYSLFRAKGKLNRLDDPGFGEDITTRLSPEELARIARMPWETYKPEMFLKTKSSVSRLLDESQNYLLDTDVSEFTKQYATAFYYYTLGLGRKVTKRGLVEKFGTVFDDKILKSLESDVADYRRRLDTIRHAIISNSPNSEAVFFKDVFNALDEIDRDYLQPANLDLSRSRYDAADDPLSLNAKISDAEGNTVELGETIADTGEDIGEGAALSKKDNYNLSSPYRSPDAFDSSTLWTVRQIIARNPQLFRNFYNLSEASGILSDFVQFKTVDDAFDFSKYVDLDDNGFLSTQYPGITIDSFLDKFQKEVIPLAKEAIAKGAAPIPTAKNAHKFKALDDLVNGSGSVSKAYATMLRGLVDDWGYAPVSYVAKDGATKTYYKFTGTLHPERFVPESRKVEFTNLLLRQPKFEFEQARKELLFSNTDLFTDSKAVSLAQSSAKLSEHFTPKKVYIPKTQKFTTRATEQAGFITEVRPATAAELAYNPITPSQLAIKHAKDSLRRVKNPAFARYAYYEKFPSMFPKEMSETVTKPMPVRIVDTVADSATHMRKGDDIVEKPHKIWHWFAQIRKAIATPLRAIGLEIDEDTGERIGRASLRTKRAEKILSRASTLISKDGITQSEVRKVLGLLTAQQGDILKGTEFVDEICKEGMVRSAFRTKAAAGAASKTLQANVNTFNAAVGKDVLQLLERKMSNGNYEVIVAFNTKNKKLVNQIAAAKKKLNSAAFMDTEFLKTHTITTEQAEFLKSEKAQKIISYLEEVDGLAKDQARALGFTFDDTAIHTKHVRDVNPETADYVANDLNNGIDLDALEEATTLLTNTDAFRSKFKGALGSRLRGRRYRGAYWNYDTSKASLFTYDLEKFAKGSLGDGMFANSNYQSFVDLFVNDNFKVKGVFEDVDDFRKFMYQGGAEGKYAGNLKNIDLCYAKYNADGRFVGIHKYNVYSDADLEKALANPDTILVPANVVDTLDKVIRKEIRLSNKVYAFINKHFTIPFKFGVLTNPGFLLGNVSDAYMKQAVTMSEKYGTSVAEELAKVGESATMYLNLGNKFNAAIEKWQADMKALGFELTATEEIPEILAGHAASRKRLIEYINGTLKGPDGNLVQNMLTDDEAGVVLLWTKLQQLQHTSNSLREFDDIADAIGSSEFDIPRNIVDRITQGSGKYDWKKLSTWGIFINNPIANSAMRASEFIENTMRGTAILNDLMHEGYSNEKIFRILLDGSITPEAAAAKLTFDVDFADAVNAMYESNFNYDRMSDFMEGVGKAMPFPTFFLKNLTYWLTLFEKNPQFFDHAITVHENMWGHRDTSEDEFLAEAKGRGAVPVGGQKLSNFFKGIYKPTPLQSMFGAFNLVNEPVENLSYRLHPLISGSAQAVNQTLPHSPLTTLLGEAKYRPYSTDIYERNVKQDDENFNSLAYAMHRSNPFERTVNTALRTPKKVAEGQAQLSDFLPSVFQPDFSKK